MVPFNCSVTLIPYYGSKIFSEDWPCSWPAGLCPGGAFSGDKASSFPCQWLRAWLQRSLSQSSLPSPSLLFRESLSFSSLFWNPFREGRWEKNPLSSASAVLFAEESLYDNTEGVGVHVPQARWPFLQHSVSHNLWALCLVKRAQTSVLRDWLCGLHEVPF